MLFHESSPARPSADSLRSRIGSVSELRKVTSYQKPNDPVETYTHLVESGSGLVGYPPYSDDRLEWSGINRHIWASVAGAVGLGKRVKEKGFAVDLNLLASGMEASHDGRRIADEAGWYKDDVVNSATILGKSNEAIGLEILAGMGIDKDVYDLVSRLAHGVEHVPTKKHVLEFLIASYTDHRTTDQFQPFADRMAGFLLTNFFKPGYDKETKDKVINWMQQTVEKGRKRELSLEGVVKEAELIGATPNSPRLALKDLMSIVVVESAFEQWLLDLGVDVDAVGKDIANPPRALAYGPRMYLNDVEVTGFAAISNSGKLESSKWGALELKRLHDKQQGTPYQGGRSPIKLVVTQDNQIKYKAPSGKLVDTVRTLKGQFTRNSKDLLKLRETPEGEQRYFAAISRVDFEQRFNKDTKKLSQKEQNLTIHHPHYTSETIDGAFTDAVNEAARDQEKGEEMIVVSGYAKDDQFFQFMEGEAFRITNPELQIDEVFADINGKYGENISVVKATRAFTSNRSLTGWQRAIDFYQYLDDTTTWQQKTRRFLSKTERRFTSFVKTLIDPKRRFVPPTIGK